MLKEYILNVIISMQIIPVNPPVFKKKVIKKCEMNENKQRKKTLQ